MMKLSALNSSRQKAEINRPERLLVWLRSLIQVSANMAVNIAVSTKSNPVRSKVISGPISPPTVAPVTQ